MTIAELKRMYADPEKNPLETARLMEALWHEIGTQQELGRLAGITPGTIHHYVSLLSLPDELQQAVEDRRLKFKAARALADLSDGRKHSTKFHETRQTYAREDVVALAQPFIDGTLSTVYAEAYVRLARSHPDLSPETLTQAVKTGEIPETAPEPVRIIEREPEPDPLPCASDVFAAALKLRGMLMNVEFDDSIDALRAKSELKRLAPVLSAMTGPLPVGRVS